MRFADIPGLENTKEKLYKTIESSKIAHAQMFAGPEGSANLALAIAYATILNCTNRSQEDACGECPSCQKIKKLVHPDVHFVFPVSSAKNKTGKDVVSDGFIVDWRQFVAKNPYAGPYEWSMEFGGEDKQLNISREESRNIVRKLSLKSFEGKYKVMIIWLAEYLHPAAANALLKLLEEPPESTIFLLVTYDPEQIISTILSRVQLLQIRSFNREEITQYLIHHDEIESQKAQQIASISNGDLNQAQRLIHEVEDAKHNMFQDWMRMCFAGNHALMVEWADEFSKSSKINQKGLFQYGLSILRDSLLLQHNASGVLNLLSEEKNLLQTFQKPLAWSSWRNYTS